MKGISRIAGAGFVSGGSVALVVGLYAGTARANLIIDPSFETPDASTADVNLPTSQAGAALNPTFPWYDLLTNTGDQAEISSDIPGFSNTPPADRINAPTVGTSGSSPGGNKANTGDQYDYAFTAGRPSGTVGGVAQLVTGIVPGDLYVGSAFFFVKNTGGTDGDRFQAGGSNDTLKLIFEDATGAQVGSTVVSTVGGNNGVIDSTVAQNTWIQVSTAAVSAPAGSSQVLFEMALTRGGTGGVQFGDDASLVDTVPEPASLGLIAACGLLVLRRPGRR
jgi:hypothetical protein